MAQHLHRRKPGSRIGNSDGMPEVATFPEDMAAIAEFLTLLEWAPGQKRQPGTLTIFVELGVLKVCLNDKETGEVAFVSGHSWIGLLATLEESLRSQGLEWRSTRKDRR